MTPDCHKAQHSHSLLQDGEVGGVAGVSELGRPVVVVNKVHPSIGRVSRLPARGQWTEVIRTHVCETPTM